MEILFRTKEESNQEQEQVFLKLPLGERFLLFLTLMDSLKDFPPIQVRNDAKTSYPMQIASKMQDWNAEIKNTALNLQPWSGNGNFDLQEITTHFT